jgi:hypothetical protein
MGREALGCVFSENFGYPFHQLRHIHYHLLSLLYSPDTGSIAK